MKKIINILIFLIISANCFSQEPVFSQYYFNPIYLNPAMSGMDNNYRLIIIIRINGLKYQESLIQLQFLLTHGKINLIHLVSIKLTPLSSA